ncbi:tRNA (adenosine(37)-N6)-threonylcarbamoyltransferase complex ATPase subunit type 1 TsaE [Actinoalloteichus hymeniacidonis]|uniref:tRNA threonylcarbamoyladenosine biosynthesis protein TsaE n=1 Tax=Actinoalloteichus hymeniacidonis TaxID=340345 RepID=A0AAC9N142_9PSEU|nr:tRNA (adenosine(37)-N6)-threonylcarbamoyltransferase complex ATPase subunit type 1 TsaE [Actinoalloteichus hymeniacidonis]AOS65747.1 tRNA threonylcarbamoyl adenosine modification protein [Actinoalloteichus hymeniacidonis]MBB5906163.1 tRNA threonylcarbamoyladenosine biosynthesis protein TsaE [Actinoalloteichus hymeniacidonis]
MSDDRFSPENDRVELDPGLTSVAAGWTAPDLEAAVELHRTLPAAEDTHELGRQLGGLARAGDLIVLSGPLGAGKTALTQGLGAGLGVVGRITSPTFVIARLHRAAPAGRGIALVHVDAYRLGGVGELEDLDLGFDLDQAVVVVEWGEGLAEALTEEHLLIRLDRKLDDSRSAVLVANGPTWTRRLADL